MQREDEMNINFSRLEGIAHLDNKILLDSNPMKEKFWILHDFLLNRVNGPEPIQTVTSYRQAAIKIKKKKKKFRHFVFYSIGTSSHFQRQAQWLAKQATVDSYHSWTPHEVTSYCDHQTV